MYAPSAIASIYAIIPQAKKRKESDAGTAVNLRVSPVPPADIRRVPPRPAGCASVSIISYFTSQSGLEIINAPAADAAWHLARLT